MQCPNCHETLIDSARFCNKCGCQIGSEAGAISSNEPSFQSSPTPQANHAPAAAVPAKSVWVVIAVCVLLLAAAALLWLFVFRPAQAPKSISVYPASLTMRAGAQEMIRCVLSPESAAQELVWTSSNSAVARVLDGTVVGVAPGSCVITAASAKEANVFSEVAVEVTAAEAPAAPTASSVNQSSTDEMIKQIKSWYYSFQNNGNVQQSRVGEYMTVSTLDGEIGEITCWPVPNDSGNPNGYIAFHYYHNGVPYFTLLQDPSKNLIRLYYDSGKIISWIEPDGVRHYGENERYTAWYDRAVASLSSTD